MSKLVVFMLFACMFQSAFAVPVSLSITNAADYRATIPSNSNLIHGIGMGPAGAYRAVRAEDTEFLLTSISERLMFAGDPLVMDNTVLKAGKIPTESWDLWDFTLTNNFMLTWGQGRFTWFGYAHARDASISFGFVPSAWKPWTGFAKLDGTNGWVRNGFDASVDIRAAFGNDSAGIPTNSIPTNIIFTFSKALDLFTVTNLYATIDSEVFKTILRLNIPRDLSVTTNELVTLYKGYPVDYNYTTYTVGNVTKSYLSSVSVGDLWAMTNTSQEVVGLPMTCYSEHTVFNSTYYGVQYDTAPTTLNPYPSGQVHIAGGPINDYDSYTDSTPGSGSPFFVRVGVAYGLDNGYACFNTNLTCDAFAVCCWTAKTVDTFYSAAIPEGRDAISISTNVVVNHVLTSHDLGPLEFAQFETAPNHPAEFPIDLWQSISNKVSDIQTVALGFAERQRCFATPFFSRPTPPYFAVDPNEIPNSVTQGWYGCEANYATAVATRRNEFSCDSIFLFLVVHPTYYARVLEPSLNTP